MAENRQVRQKHMHRRALRCELPGESGAIGEDYHVHYGMARANLKNASTGRLTYFAPPAAGDNRTEDAI